MGVYRVEVEVTTARPPRNDATVYVEVEARNGQEAEMLAVQIAWCNRAVVMPVASVVTDWPTEGELT